jgi:hypothetical protein
MKAFIIATAAIDCTKSMDVMVQTNAATVCKWGGAVVESDFESDETR